MSDWEDRGLLPQGKALGSKDRQSQNGFDFALMPQGIGNGQQ